MKYLTNLFAKPDARAFAERKLREAELQLLDSQDAAEYASALASYHANRIRRLQKHLEAKEAA